MEVGDQIIVYLFKNVPQVILMCPTGGYAHLSRISVPSYILENVTIKYTIEIRLANCLDTLSHQIIAFFLMKDILYIQNSSILNLVNM